MPLDDNPYHLEPQAQLRWFREKGYALNFDWRDQWGEEHARAFTVAKATQLDILADLRQAVDDAIANGTGPQEFIKALRPTLEKKGWWGEKEEKDPVTGEVKSVQLGSARRLRTILDTNLRQVNSAAKWERIERTAQARPYLRYVAQQVGDERRPEHQRWHNTILPYDHPWWRTHFTPNGWGCQCEIQQLSERDLERYGFKVSAKAPPVKMVPYYNARTGKTLMVPKGIDPGFDYNPGLVRRGFTPPDNAPVLKPVRTFVDFGRPKANDAQEARPKAPELWPSEHTPADRQRTNELFRSLFGVKPGRDEAVIKDAQGEQVTVSMRLLDHLRGEHKGDKPGVPDQARTQYTALVRDTIEQPYEIWMVPFRLDDGRVVMRKRYIGLYGDAKELVVVNRGDDGYVAWTAMPSRNIDSQRQGDLLYPR
ncbi:MAG TPA: PBECR2 nuclease fold domain-containing protein [Polyangiaceae bacterium]|nr:PBECR2 nuclease fold domain-containing protein [Polyangiaceae bacterium]